MQFNSLSSRVLTYGLRYLLLLAGLGVMMSVQAQQIGFLSADVVTGLTSPTSLQFGPDGRLYVSQQNGTLKVYTIQRNAPGSYQVLSTETILLVKENTPNHNDDGTFNSTKTRQVTGLLVLGTANNPVLYVSSSDWRIAVGNDSNLDTNSGLVSRLTWIGADLDDPNGYWDKVDLVRGLPRSEENHATNGMDYDAATNRLFLAIGGNANKGAPSNNFSGTPEYALNAAILTIDLNALNAMPVYTDPRTNTKFVYDLPTLDDPTRANITNAHPAFPYPPGHPYYNQSIDLHDPFGGNNGLNQARWIVGGPVQVYASGFRNPYDVLFTSLGRLYTFDNGPNSGWGGQPLIYDINGNPKGTGPADPAAGDYASNEINETSSGGHADQLHFIANEGYYGGYPNPTRADPLRSGIYSYEKVSGVWNLTGTYNWATDFPHPAVDPVLARPIEMVYMAPNHPNSQSLTSINSSTNGITEYTASNFGGAMQGDLLAVAFNDNVYRFQLNAAGDALVSQTAMLNGFGDNPLDITAQGDNQVFPGTIWVALHGANKIVCFEPNDFEPFNCTGANDPNLDEDGDGFSNFDEILNGTDPCSQGSKPKDYDGDFISNLLDTDDDNDGWLDTYDPFSVDPNNGMTTFLPIDYSFSINNNDAVPGSLFGLGFTGVMTNGNFVTQTPGDDYLNLYVEENLKLGGAVSKLGISGIQPGTALQGNNNQFNAFQFGLNVDVNSEPFTYHSEVESPYFLVNGTPITPINDMSAGIFIGRGDQDNYIQVAVHAGGGQGGIRVVREVNGVATVADYGTAVVGNVLASNATDLFLSVNPATLKVQPKISLNGGATIVAVGPELDIPASWLSATDNVGLAIGIISTSANSGTPFGATWDFISVRGATPTASGIEDKEVLIGANPETISLDSYFQDDQGVANLVYTIQSNTCTLVQASISGNQLMLTYPANDTDNGQIVVRATDADGNFVQDTFLVTVLEPLVVLYRVNAAGPLLASTDAPNPDWSSDAPATPSPFRTNGNNTSNASYTTLDASIPSYLPLGVFSTERWDPATGGEMMWDFPAPTPGIYEVRLFLNNSHGGTSGVGTRVFDISVEGTVVWDNLDLIQQFGHKNAGMLTYQVSVTDGNLDIDFDRVVENPLINAIEVLGPPAPGTVPSNPQLAVNPSSVHFFSTQIGVTSPAQSVTLSNPGNASVTVSSITLGGSNPGMFAHSATTPLIIPAGGTSVVNVTFTPTAVGSPSASLSFVHNGTTSSPLVVNLDGEAIPGPSALEATPSTFDFGQVAVNASSAAQVFTLSNTGSDTILISAVNLAGANASEFSLNFSALYEILPGASANVSVTFSPTSAGTKTALLQVGHSATNPSPLEITLSGFSVDPSAPTASEVLYRINTGGVLTTALDAPQMNWAGDGNGGAASPFRNNSSNISASSYNTVDPSVPAYVPMSIYSTERWDTGSAPDMQWDFPIADPGTYEVRLYFLNSFNGTSTPGKRVFDVVVEGVTVLDDFDLIVEFGHKVAGMKSIVTTVNDGNLDIDFGRVIGDPLINGIEIVKMGSGPALPSVVITSPTAGLVVSGTEVTVTWAGSNLDPLDHYHVSIDGLPHTSVVQPNNSYTFTGLTAGAHTVSVQLADYTHTEYTHAGAIATVTFTTEIPVPTVVIISPTAGQVISGTDVTVTWTGMNLDPLDHYHVSIDGLPHTSVVQPDNSYTFTGLTAGSHTVIVQLADYTHTEYTNVGATAAVTFSTTDPSGAIPLYRINAGGGGLAALDAPNMNWAGDGQGGYASPFRGPGSNVSAASYNSVHSSVPTYTPLGIFAQERWDTGGAPDMQWDFPVANGTYEIHLFFLNSFNGTSTPGKRVFDVVVEGVVVLNDFDIIPEFGHKVAGMKTIVATVTDGNLDIDFGRVIGDPLINGIEILEVAAPEGTMSMGGEPGGNGGSNQPGTNSLSFIGPESSFFGYDLKQNYPNPFSEVTRAGFELPEAAEVKITIYNMLGQPVREFGGTYPAGEHEVVWYADGKGGERVAAGVYHMVMQASNGFRHHIKMQLVE